MLVNLSKYIFLSLGLFLILSATDLFAQVRPATNSNRIQIKQADVLVGQTNAYRKLRGNVILTQKTSTIYCDSVTLDDLRNEAKAYGNVRIIDSEDPVVITSKYLLYEGNTRIVRLRDKVVMRDDKSTLYTDQLDYERETGISYYYDGGKLVDTTNVLTSERGTYNSITKKAVFVKKVVLVNPDYTLNSDTLDYYTDTKIATTEGLTKIVSKNDDLLTAREGLKYDTRQETFEFYQGRIENDKSITEGDWLFYDKPKMFYEGKGDVSLYSKEREMYILGDEGEYYEDRGFSKVFGKALMKKLFENDTLFVAADTLVSQDSPDIKEKYVSAYYGVRIFKNDLQGKADSLAYQFTDSTIYLYNDPILWSEENQMEADSMRILTANEAIDKIYMKDRSFVTSKDTSDNFNQIKGREMLTHLKDEQISKVDVSGNAESIYYVWEKDSILMGMNKLICSDMLILFLDGKVSRIKAMAKPEGTLTPPDEFVEDQRLLQGFAWRVEERTTYDDILAWRRAAVRRKLLQEELDQLDEK